MMTESQIQAAARFDDIALPADMFVSGWFTQQFETGVKPDYGYPKNHLPEVTAEAMQFTTGFLAKKKGA